MHKKAEKKPLNSISIYVVWWLILVVHITLLLIKYLFFLVKEILIVNTNN